MYNEIIGAPRHLAGAKTNSKKINKLGINGKQKIYIHTHTQNKRKAHNRKQSAWKQCKGAWSYENYKKLSEKSTN